MAEAVLHTNVYISLNTFPSACDNSSVTQLTRAQSKRLETAN